MKIGHSSARRAVIRRAPRLAAQVSVQKTDANLGHGAISVTVAAEYLGAQGRPEYIIRCARCQARNRCHPRGNHIAGILSVPLNQVIRFIFARLTVWAPKDGDSAALEGSCETDTGNGGTSGDGPGGR
jgi:hypothetical protein